ncbi:MULTISPECIES: spore coat protein U domain-containing protein [unclassified Phyllobacterium]|uniref:Csu type fimbrial protein n=1 Tax=Phyllobacterium TaxID=28100 RepID=UPI00179C6B49|nr:MULTISPECIES: spore coat protein U domain-containing protein [unclassified Phyllobacterium]MBA8902350.1 spore coat protein U-like protein [Phyllobacterium sp. P30BS-XVII]UGX87087.1 spore coat U domain-containing protein [Phyllobacterium sp. T1293]
MRNWLLRFVFFVGVLLLPAVVWAQSCTFTVPGIVFSGSTIPGNVINSMTTVKADCSGLLGLGRKVLVCPDLNEGSGGATSSARKMLSGANVLNYQLFQDAARSIVWGSITWPYAARAPGFLVEFTTILGPLLGSGSTTITLYGQVLASQQAAPAGTYISTFTGANATFHYRYDDGAGCSVLNGALTGSPPSFNAQITLANDCLVTAQNIDFGNRGLLNANIDQTGQVNVTCTPTVPYTVSLSLGGTGTSPTARKMTGTTGGVVTYGLYRDTNRTLPWGNTIGTNTVAGTGSGASQPIIVYGRVPPQTTPAPGSYDDTIIVTVTY